ncbi:hypothetical protein D3C87_1499150 [compost metagenome]
MFDHFQAAEHVSLGIRQRLALFCRENRRQFLDVFADQLLILEEYSGAGADWRFAPSLEGFLGAGHGGVHFFGGGKGHSGQYFLGSRVDHITPLSGLGFDQLAVDQQLYGRDAIVSHCFLFRGDEALVIRWDDRFAGVYGVARSECFS